MTKISLEDATGCGFRKCHIGFLIETLQQSSASIMCYLDETKSTEGRRSRVCPPPMEETGTASHQQWREMCSALQTPGLLLMIEQRSSSVIFCRLAP